MKESFKKAVINYYTIGKSFLLKHKLFIRPIIFWQLFITIINFTKLNLFLLILIGIISIFVSD